MIRITTGYLKIIGEGPGGELTFCSSEYRPLSTIRYLDANPLLTRYTLFTPFGDSVSSTTILYCCLTKKNGYLILCRRNGKHISVGDEESQREALLEMECLLIS